MNSENFKIISVSSRAIHIEVLDPNQFTNEFNLGSYLKIPYKNIGDKYAVGIIENYKIKDKVSIDGEVEAQEPSFVLELELIGSVEITNGKSRFIRGGHGIPLPPNNGISLMDKKELQAIFTTDLQEKERFCFATSILDSEIDIPVNGNKFFNKHFAIVGSTGSGKSHTVAKILQNAIFAKNSEYDGLNNSHIIIFDIHNEYSNAFPNANLLNINNLTLPYWLLNSEELQELFLDTEANDHNQRNVFKEAIINNKREFLKKKDDEDNIEFERRRNKVHFDSPIFFDINLVLDYAQKKNEELVETGEIYKTGNNKGKAKTIKGSLNGKLTNFVSRLSNKLNDRRLDFLIGEESKKISFEKTLRQFIGYKKNETSNVTIIDLGGIPFEVLSITVSLISRILFDYGYFYKKKIEDISSCETPLLLLYEEAHKYVPKSNLAKYRASKIAIERIAKEGRKYGVTLGIVSQRPSEISETIFSQCNNFISMRLSNPDDQSYVKRLLPDTLGNLTDTLPTLKCGEALLIGEAISLPSLVKIDKCDLTPKSTDIMYYEVWKERWKDVNFDDVINEWKK